MMLSTNPPFHIITNLEIRKHLSEDEFFALVPPFFLLVNKGDITVDSDKKRTISANTISVYVKDEGIQAVGLSEDCECILLQYDRKYIRSMTLKLDLLDAFKYVYSDPQLTFSLPKNELEGLWFLANYISNQVKNSQHSDLETHIFRHLNYSFLYSCIERINRASSFEANPKNQQEKLVLNFLKNLQTQGSSKLKVSDYAKMQHVTTRHLSTTVKQDDPYFGCLLRNQRGKSAIFPNHIIVNDKTWFFYFWGLDLLGCVMAKVYGHGGSILGFSLNHHRDYCRNCFRSCKLPYSKEKCNC